MESMEKRMLHENEAIHYIGLGRNLAREFLENIGAKVYIGRRVLYDKKVIDAALDSMVGKVEGDE